MILTCFLQKTRNYKNSNNYNVKITNTPPNQKNNFSFLHIKPTHFNEFLISVDGPNPMEIMKTSIKTNTNRISFWSSYNHEMLLLHIKPTLFYICGWDLLGNLAAHWVPADSPTPFSKCTTIKCQLYQSQYTNVSKSMPNVPKSMLKLL